MHFLYPSFLWALFSVAIPVSFTFFISGDSKEYILQNVKYLKEIKEETSNRNKLKNILVLISRCLAVIAMVFAFAQPFFPVGDLVKTGVNTISVFIDNSFSMTSKRQDIPLLDYAKERATAIVEAYAGDDKFQILTHDFEGKHQRLLSKEDALSYVDDIIVTPNVQSLDKVLNRQKQLLDTEVSNKISYIISDFQKSISNLGYYKDTTMEVDLLPVQNVQQENISVDSVWFDGPIPVLFQNNKLVVRVKNNTNEEIEQVKLAFSKDGQVKPIGIRDIPANGMITDTVFVTIAKSGWQRATVSVTDYPVQFDDEYYIAFNVPDTIKALIINENAPNKYMDALFKGVNYFKLSNQSVSQLQYQQFDKFDLIILNDLKNISSGLSSELSQYVRNGGKTLLFPSENANIPSYNSFLAACSANVFSSLNKNKKEVSSVNTEEFIFSDVYLNTRDNLKLPVSLLSYDQSSSVKGIEEKLLAYRDGTAYLSKYRVGEGQLFVCAGPLDSKNNNLVFNAEIFVPMVYKMAISSTSQKKLAHTISNRVVLETENKRKSGDFVYKIKGKEEFIPGQIPNGNKVTLELNDQIRTSGFYELMLDKEMVGLYAFNYDRKESDLNTMSEKELENINPANNKIKVISSALQANISGTISEKDKGIVLWKWFLIAALVFLAIESLLLRFFKN